MHSDKIIIKEKWLTKGTIAIYKKLGTSVTILDIHYDPEGTYYTIGFPDGRERGTTIQSLSVNCIENIPRIFNCETEEVLNALFTKKTICKHMKQLNCYHSSFLKKSMIRFLMKYYQNNNT